MWRSVVPSGPVFRQWRFNLLVVSMAATHFSMWVLFYGVTLFFFFFQERKYSSFSVVCGCDDGISHLMLFLVVGAYQNCSHELFIVL
jgi:hypothetical protein